MPVPAGGAGAAVLFTQAELTIYARGLSVDADSYALALRLVTTAIRGYVGSSTYDNLTDLSPLMLVALDLGRRILRNADGLRSSSYQIDDYTETRTFAAETLDVPDLTADDQARIDIALGRATSGAFTIRPAYIAPATCVRETPWRA